MACAVSGFRGCANLWPLLASPGMIPHNSRTEQPRWCHFLFCIYALVAFTRSRVCPLEYWQENSTVDENVEMCPALYHYAFFCTKEHRQEQRINSIHFAVQVFNTMNNVNLPVASFEPESFALPTIVSIYISVCQQEWALTHCSSNGASPPVMCKQRTKI